MNEDIIKLMQEAFKAGGNAATFNGYPGQSDAPQLEEWIKSKEAEVKELCDQWFWNNVPDQ